MADEFYITGPVKWAKVYKPDTKFDDNGIYSIQVYLDDESKAIVKKSGLRVAAKADEDGEYITLRRKKVVWFGPKEGDKDIGPPIVVDENNKDFDKLIGNGSVCTCKFEVYPTKKGPGHRLLKVRVDQWVEYEKPNDDEVEEVPEEEPAPKPKAAKGKGMPF